MTYTSITRRRRGRIGLPLQATVVCPLTLGAILIVSGEARGADSVPANPDSAPPPAAPSPSPVVVAPIPAAPQSTTIAAPAPPVANTAVAEANASKLPTDHEIVVGAMGIGYVGTYRVPLPQAMPTGRGDQAGMIPNDKMNIRQILVPTLGLRKWFSRRYGFEAGLGLAISGGSRDAEYGTTSATVDKAAVFAISGQIGVPILIADTHHMAFVLIPEARFGLATSNANAEFEENHPPPAKLRGGAIDAGLRAGAELHFGFIGLPRLSMQAGVAVYLRAQWASASVSNQSLSDTTVDLNMGSAGNPWDIFSGVANVSARYYF